MFPASVCVNDYVPVFVLYLLNMFMLPGCVVILDPVH